MQAQLRRVRFPDGWRDASSRKGGNYAGILIPYFHPNSGLVRDYRCRRDQPDVEYDSAGNVQDRPDKSTSLRPDVPTCSTSFPALSGTSFPTPALPVVLTESDTRLFALWRARISYRATGQRGSCPLEISGVYNWRGSIGKTVGPDGCRMDVKGAIPDLDWIVWNGQPRHDRLRCGCGLRREPVRITVGAGGTPAPRGALVGFLEWDISKGQGDRRPSRQSGT